jgi:hypothetical protein
MAPRRPLDPDTDENFAQLLKIREDLERRTARRFEVAKFVWVLGSAVVALTLWLGGIQWASKDHEKRITHLEGFEVWGREAKAKNDLDLQEIRNRQTTMESAGTRRDKQIETLDTMREKVQKMWDQRMSVRTNQQLTPEEREDDKKTDAQHP